MCEASVLVVDDGRLSRLINSLNRELFICRVVASETQAQEELVAKNYDLVIIGPTHVSVADRAWWESRFPSVGVMLVSDDVTRDVQSDNCVIIPYGMSESILESNLRFLFKVVVFIRRQKDTAKMSGEVSDMIRRALRFFHDRLVI